MSKLLVRCDHCPCVMTLIYEATDGPPTDRLTERAYVCHCRSYAIEVAREDGSGHLVHWPALTLDPGGSRAHRAIVEALP